MAKSHRGGPTRFAERRTEHLVSRRQDAINAKDAVRALDWWHVIEIAPGLVTPGSWDLRPTAERMPWPASLEGGRCLDVGTMDGFWAFELERRGAGEVVAIDLVDPARHDSPSASGMADPHPRGGFAVRPSGWQPTCLGRVPTTAT